MIAMTPECELELSNLKEEMFYNNSQAEMYRYLINRGLETVSNNNNKILGERDE